MSQTFWYRSKDAPYTITLSELLHLVLIPCISRRIYVCYKDARIDCVLEGVDDGNGITVAQVTEGARGESKRISLADVKRLNVHKSGWGGSYVYIYVKERAFSSCF